MATPFLYQFSVVVVTRLLEGERLEIRPGSEDRVARFVADALSDAREGSSLISSLSAALIASPDVEELYADTDELKELVSDLGV